MKVIYLILCFSFIIVLFGNICAGTLDDIRAKFGKTDLDKSAGRDESDIVVLDKKEAEKFIFSQKGKDFLRLYGTGWKHARAGNFIFHFRKMSNMKKLARIVEKMFNKISGDLSIEGEDFVWLKDKIIIYLMDDEGRWKRFLDKVREPKWAAGFACGDEVFLHIDWGNTRYRSFALRMLAHEMTHIIFGRLYPGKMPVWLNEGFAEYQEAAAGKYIKQAAYARPKEMNKTDFFNIDELVELQDVPCGDRHHTFYLQSGRLVSFLYGKHGKENFLKFVKIIQTGAPFQKAVMKVYKDQYPSYKIFKSKAARYK